VSLSNQSKESASKKSLRSQRALPIGMAKPCGEHYCLSSPFSFFVFSAAGEFSAAMFGALAFGLGLELRTGRMNSAFKNGHNRRDIQLSCGDIYRNDADLHRLA
jgi:hypothetical protein